MPLVWEFSRFYEFFFVANLRFFDIICHLIWTINAVKKSSCVRLLDDHITKNKQILKNPAHRCIDFDNFSKSNQLDIIRFDKRSFDNNNAVIIDHNETIKIFYHIKNEFQKRKIDCQKNCWKHHIQHERSPKHTLKSHRNIEQKSREAHQKNKFQIIK